MDFLTVFKLWILLTVSGVLSFCGYFVLTLPMKNAWTSTATYYASVSILLAMPFSIALFGLNFIVIQALFRNLPFSLAVIITVVCIIGMVMNWATMVRHAADLEGLDHDNPFISMIASILTYGSVVTIPATAIGIIFRNS